MIRKLSKGKLSKLSKAWRSMKTRSMKVAIEGCCHGELDNIYDHIKRLEDKNGYKVDLLLLCGDFQALRNLKDSTCMAVPDKYKDMKDFYKYYTKKKTAPILTLVIGGNHEASNYLWELYHGGWLAPNIYYLGNAGCVKVNGVRIAGASGIYKSHDYRLGHYERLPYDRSTMRSIYHIRDYDVQKLSLLSKPDVVLSHDWPQHIAHHGNLSALLRKKSFFREDIKSGALGSPPLMSLLQKLRPNWWFSAHLHTKFEATVEHRDKNTTDPQNTPQASSAIAGSEVPTHPHPEIERNPDEIMLDDEEDDVVAPPPPPPPPAPPTSVTKFLALDKCLPKRDFLEVVDIPSPYPAFPPTLSFDSEWLAITRALHPWLSTTRNQPVLPDAEQLKALVDNELVWVNENVTKKLGENMKVEDCQQFVMTAPGPAPGEGSKIRGRIDQPAWYTNPQTVALCSLLEIENKINPPPKFSSSAEIPTPAAHSTETLDVGA